MKKFGILAISFCLALNVFLTRSSALENIQEISAEELTAINEFNEDLGNAYDSIITGNDSYSFWNILTGKDVTNDVIGLFEKEFKIHKYDSIRDYLNENQIAIVHGKPTTSIMPNACIGDGCPDSSIKRSISEEYKLNFVNKYYLEVYGETQNQTAKVTFSASYEEATNGDFLYWYKSSGLLTPDLENGNAIDGLRLKQTSINYNDSTGKATATFSLYAYTAQTSNQYANDYEYFLSSSSLTLAP